MIMEILCMKISLVEYTWSIQTSYLDWIITEMIKVQSLTGPWVFLRVYQDLNNSRWIPFSKSARLAFSCERFISLPWNTKLRELGNGNVLIVPNIKIIIFISPVYIYTYIKYAKFGLKNRKRFWNNDLYEELNIEFRRKRGSRESGRSSRGYFNQW